MYKVMFNTTGYSEKEANSGIGYASHINELIVLGLWGHDGYMVEKRGESHYILYNNVRYISVTVIYKDIDFKF